MRPLALMLCAELQAARLRPKRMSTLEGRADISPDRTEVAFLRDQDGKRLHDLDIDRDLYRDRTTKDCHLGYVLACGGPGSEIAPSNTTGREHIRSVRRLR